MSQVQGGGLPRSQQRSMLALQPHTTMEAELNMIKTREEALKYIEDNWDSQGECRSCGWHASLHEHMLEVSDLDELIKDGKLWLPCQNPEDQGCRGVTIYAKNG